MDYPGLNRVPCQWLPNGAVSAEACMTHRQRIQRVLRLCFLINRAQAATALYELSNFNVYRLVPSA
jgi:hypothetical protein